MNVQVNVSADAAALWDGYEAVTLVRPGAVGSTTAPHALRRELVAKEAEVSGGRFIEGDVAWHLAASELSRAPRVGDQIVDALRVRWTILSAQQATLGTRWRCVTRNLAIVHGLSEVVRIQLARWTKGESGAATAMWSDVRSGVSARIQPLSVEQRRDHQAKTDRATHNVYLLDGDGLTTDHRIVDADGKLHYVVSYQRPNRIDQLAVAATVQTPWPEP